MRFTCRYGIDAPFWVSINICIGLILTVISLFGLPSSIFGLIFGLYFLGVGLWMFLYSTVIKIRHREVILDMGTVREGERLLDIGIGRGLLAIAASHRGAVVTGIDKWSSWDLGGNGRAALAKNVEVEGVAPFEVLDGDVRELPFDNETFDVLVSNFVIHNVKGKEERARAIHEMWRVLKPGGRLLISDIYRVGEYIEVLGKLTSKMETKKFRYTFPFSEVVVAYKS